MCALPIFESCGTVHKIKHPYRENFYGCGNDHIIICSFSKCSSKTFICCVIYPNIKSVVILFQVTVPSMDIHDKFLKPLSHQYCIGNSVSYNDELSFPHTVYS